jgi:hypothetical protein
VTRRRYLLPRGHGGGECDPGTVAITTGEHGADGQEHGSTI